MNSTLTSSKPRTALIVGVANDHSIAWGIAKHLKQAGYELAFTYQGDTLERRVRPLAESVDAKMVLPLDLRNDDQIKEVFTTLGKTWTHLDAMVHAAAFADKRDLEGRFLHTQREGFSLAMDVSAYSLIALLRAGHDLLKSAPHGASVLTLSYYGAEKVIPHYNVMGVAKAALEAAVRYLAADVGPEGIRVNAISAGPVRTLAAAGIKGFKSMMHLSEEKAPLRRNVSLDEIGSMARLLLSSEGAGITGQTIYVDSGYSILGM